DAYALSEPLRALVPAQLALHYAVLPLREEGKTLILASESAIDPVSLAALSRKLARPVRYVIAGIGEVTVGLRHWYARHRSDDPRAQLDAAAARFGLPPMQVAQLWRRYVTRQLMFADILTSLGHLDDAALKTLLLRHEREDIALGQFLVEQAVISADTLAQVLKQQQMLQLSMPALLRQSGIWHPGGADRA
ncbi:MAG TPA: glycosyl transferase family protein, partial [Chitinolyticbacter sp.]|nr:glycosyl transferase family protein [Chitinolyticbacter sp.]